MNMDCRFGRRFSVGIARTPWHQGSVRLALLMGCWYSLGSVAASSGEATTASGPLVDPRFREPIVASRKIVDAIRTNHGNRITAISIAVLKDERIVWSEAFGIADLSTQTLATRKTKFRAASVSKALTASLCAKLAEAGKIDLDADVRKFVPRFPDKGHKISLRMLLGHLACIRHYEREDRQADAPGGSIDARSYGSSEDALAIFADAPLVCEPGEKYSYSTFGYTLISAALEGALKKPFPEILQTELLTPLKLTSIEPDMLDDIRPDKARFYQDDGKIIESAPVNCAYKVAGGGLISTAEDLARFGAAHFQEGFFSNRTLEQLFTLQKLADGSPSRTGLGWRVGEDLNGRRTYHHAGAMPGARSIIVIYPEERMAIAIMTNVWAEPANIRKYSGEVVAQFLRADGK